MKELRIDEGRADGSNEGGADGSDSAEESEASSRLLQAISSISLKISTGPRSMGY